MRNGTTAHESGTTLAEGWVEHRVRHIAVVVQQRTQVDGAMAAVERLAAGGCLRLSVIGIPVQRPVVNHLAPLSGAVSFDQLSDEAVEDASCAARLAVLAAPSHAEATYRCLDDWRAPCLLGGLRDGAFCALVLGGGRPERRADRKRLASAARDGGTRVVIAVEDSRRGFDTTRVTLIAPQPTPG